MHFRFAAFALLLGSLSAPSRAEVQASSPSSFVLRGERVVAAAPSEVWRAVGRIGRWWDDEHTYSGDASRMSLDMRAGGCFCERWDRQSVEHARVVQVMEQEGRRTVRMVGALGPLQSMSANGVLTITVTPDAVGTRITLNYRVAGDTSLGFDALASDVDGVLMTQLDRLAVFAAGDAPLR
jgi:uncharacterized protein YndB with AHSA1/START domain